MRKTKTDSAPFFVCVGMRELAGHLVAKQDEKGDLVRLVRCA